MKSGEKERRRSLQRTRRLVAKAVCWPSLENSFRTLIDAIDFLRIVVVFLVDLFDQVDQFSVRLFLLIFDRDLAVQDLRFNDVELVHRVDRNGGIKKQEKETRTAAG